MQTERTYGRMEWIFYIIVLPLLFTALLSGFVLQLLGYNVTGTLTNVARHTPVISAIVPPDDATKKERSEVRKLETQLAEVNKKIETLQSEKEQFRQESLDKDTEINQLKQKLDELQKKAVDQSTADEYWSNEAKVFSQMTPSKAAEVISQLPQDQARAILSRMKVDVKAAVLEKLDPKVAAKLQ